MRDEYPPPGPGARLAGTPREAITAELLGLCDEFFRQASPVVHTELRQFLTGHGYHPIAGHGWFIDSVSLSALNAGSWADNDSRPEDSEHSTGR